MSPNAWRVAVAELYMFQDCTESEAIYTLAVARGAWWPYISIPAHVLERHQALFQSVMSNESA